MRRLRTIPCLHSTFPAICAPEQRGLKLAGIDRHTPDPAGGIIRRDADGEPDGVLEESPVYETIMPLLPTQTREQRIDDLAATTRIMPRGASPRRWTRPCSPTTTRSFCAPYRSRGASRSGGTSSLTSLDPDDPRLAFDGKDVTIGGVKLLADGSLQGYTGYLTKPYHTPYQGDPNGGAIPRTAARICSR